jgi:hypothetical protein
VAQNVNMTKNCTSADDVHASYLVIGPAYALPDPHAVI